eukprot:Gb_19317 [translate_table: standard]
MPPWLPNTASESFSSFGRQKLESRLGDELSGGKTIMADSSDLIIHRPPRVTFAHTCHYASVTQYALPYAIELFVPIKSDQYILQEGLTCLRADHVGGNLPEFHSWCIMSFQMQIFDQARV